MVLEALAHPIVVIVASGTLVGVFLRGAAHKFLDFTWFAHTLAEYRILPVGLAVPAAGFLLAAEVAITLGLVLPETRFYAAAGAACLLVLYGAAIAVNLLRGRTRIDCGCGGAGQGLSWFLVGRNLALVGLALIAGQQPGAGDIGAVGWFATLATIASFWLLLAGAEKLADNLSYLAAADDGAHRRDAGMETH
ncbi:hypothetical protein MesoLjLc_20730 [Mesorhizobium sp. L-8-10]|uniref:MauE/DoxX family redox-associated membrane protein n=1 Tax=Mesorhizobium sp. L-8-10 TaxID=2744523 RepID=UPI00192565A8|nr:MauE/DoxX family redox-associated membrane protein [Mesorhizobium sp. L-8-10]BCH30143.1 hypothetical protein MesoLjLc_20730 [Mesorhizobium sp. L-8-10]